MKVSLGNSHKTDCRNFGFNYKLLFDEVDDGECMEIHALDFLDYVSHEEIGLVVSGLVKKMRKGCEITLGGTDVFETAKQLLRGDHTIISVNQILFAEGKKGQYSLMYIAHLLSEAGLKITEKQIDYNKMYVKAVRE